MGEYIVPNSGIVLFLGTEVTTVVTISDTQLPDGRTVNTPVLKLYHRNQMDECGDVTLNESKFICSFDYRNAMQASQFLYDLISDDVSSYYFTEVESDNSLSEKQTEIQGRGSISESFFGGVTIDALADSPFPGYHYYITIKLATDVDDVYDEKFTFDGHFHRIKLLADVIRKFALDRHVYYHEYLMSKKMDMLENRLIDLEDVAVTEIV